MGQGHDRVPRSPHFDSGSAFSTPRILGMAGSAATAVAEKILALSRVADIKPAEYDKL